MPLLYLCLSAALIGIVEGVTEWLPISSTGHMLLIDEWLGLRQGVSPSFYSFFMVAVQLGAILAVLFLYFKRLNPFQKSKSRRERKEIFRIWRNVVLGVLPACAVGVFLDDFLEEHASGSIVIASMLVLYGVAFLLIEKRQKQKKHRIETVEALTYKDAFLIGCFQTLSLVPGTSRSGATILGGMLLGVSRTASAEFSFFLGIPVMLGATVLRGVKFFLSGEGITHSEGLLLFIGLTFSFLISWISIRFLMEFVKRHSFTVFGWYRIFLGLFILAFAIFKGTLFV